MRALLAAAAAVTLLSVPAAHADTFYRLSMSCDTNWAVFLWDHTGAAEVHAEADASSGSTSQTSVVVPTWTAVSCTVSWTYSSPIEVSASNPGGTTAVAGAGTRSGTPTVCVRASATFSDGYVLDTWTLCRPGTSVVATVLG